MPFWRVKTREVFISHHSPSAGSRPQSPSSSSHDHDEPAERIERFRESAQNLLAVYGPTERGGDSLPAPDAGGEIRRYYFSPAIVRRERELLRKPHAQDFRSLLAATDTLLHGLVRMMKSTHPEARLKGYVISSLGSLFEQVSSLTLAMNNLYAEVEPLNY